MHPELIPRLFGLKYCCFDLGYQLDPRIFRNVPGVSPVFEAGSLLTLQVSRRHMSRSSFSR